MIIWNIQQGSSSVQSKLHTWEKSVPGLFNTRVTTSDLTNNIGTALKERLKKEGNNRRLNLEAKKSAYISECQRNA